MSRLGRYEVGPLLGEGGQGRVHRAVLHGPGGFRKVVALKLLHDGATLRREAQIGGLLRHANLVDVYEVGQVGPVWFCAMEYCAGGTVADLDPLPPRAIVEVGLQVCAALDYAHRELGLVHLDLKPANLLLAGSTVKVGDLGIATARGFDPHTRIAGTRGYIAPEQQRGVPVDARADIYALGMVLLKLATGATSRDAPTQVDPRDDAAPPHAAAWLEPVRARMVDRDPERRFGSMAEVADALRALKVEGHGLAAVLDPAPTSGTSHPGVGAGLADDGLFVGREAELTWVAAALGQPGLVLLKGPGGMGKTRLAREAAQAYRRDTGERAWFCDLSEVRSTRGALNALATALSVPLGTGADDQLVDQLGHALASRGPALLLLDTCERLGASAVLLTQLAERAPAARLLATSVVALDVGERALDIDVLPWADSVELLAARALERGRDVRDDPALVQIAHRLEGVPFALELAAGRIGVLSPAEVLEHLGLSWLRHGRADAPDRHRTLRSTLDWSWALLQPPEQDALSQLSVFRGGFEAEAAEAVLDLPHRPFVLDVLQTLCNRSWLTWRDGRFRLLESARDYASDSLGNPAAVEARHGRHYALLGEREAIARLQNGSAPTLRELDNLVAATRRAVERGDSEVAVGAGRAAWEVLHLTGPFASGLELIQAVLDMPGHPPALQAAATDLLGSVYSAMGRTEEAQDHFESAFQATQGLPDRTLRADVLIHLGLVNRVMAGRVPADTHTREALALYREAGDVRGQARALSNLARSLNARGDSDEGRAILQEALLLYAQVGDLAGRANVLNALAILDFAQGNLEASEQSLVEGLALHQAVGNRRSEAVVMGNLGSLYQSMERADASVACFERALAVHREIGNRVFEGLVLGNLGVVHALNNHDAQAVQTLGMALSIFRELGHRANEADTLARLAGVLGPMGDVEEARRLLQAAEPLVDVDDAMGRCRVWIQGVGVEIEAGDFTAAAALLDRIRALADRSGFGPTSDVGRAVLRLQAVIDRGP